MENDFVIDQVSWHTQRERNYEFDKSVVYAAMKNFIRFIQMNGLTTKTILAKNDNATDNTCVKRSDLTDEGYTFLKKVYDKWSDMVIDKKILPTDYKLLNKALTSVQQGK